MKLQLTTIIILAFACYSAATGADPTESEQIAAAAKLREEIRNAATAFCTELRKERVEGLPTVEQLQRLTPLLAPEFPYLFEKARAYQKDYMRKYPDEKPYWIEGDLFSSSFEGVTSWELGDVQIWDSTVKVKQTCRLPGEEPVTWTDTLFFKKIDGRWLLENIRMGGEWAFKSGTSLRGILPGGEWAGTDHESLDERWQVAFTREDETVTQITIAPTDKSAPPAVLFGSAGESCPEPTWVVWNPECDKLAIRLGDSERFTRTLIFRLVSNVWQPVKMPEFYPEQKRTIAANGFKEIDSLVDAERWQDANTLVVRYFASYTNGDDGDGYLEYTSVRIGDDGGATVVGRADVENEPGKQP